jgi:hypothetical protein
MPRSLNDLNEKEIKSLSLRDFENAAQRTQDPRKLMLGLNLVEQVEAAFQEQIKQQLRDMYGVDPKGKIRLNVIINEYESVKNGTTYHGYVRASFDSQSKILYRLTEEELAKELKRRQTIQPADSSASLSR